MPMPSFAETLFGGGNTNTTKAGLGVPGRGSNPLDTFFGRVTGGPGGIGTVGESGAGMGSGGTDTGDIFSQMWKKISGGEGTPWGPGKTIDWDSIYNHVGAAPPRPDSNIIPGTGGLGTINGSTGTLWDAFQMQDPGQLENKDISLGDIGLGKAGTEMQNRALAKGPSEWLKLQLEGQGNEEKNAMQTASTGAAQQAAAAQANLMRQGGMSSGARERLAKQGTTSGWLGQQDVVNKGISNRIGLQSTDEANKLALLGQVGGMENDLSKTNLGKNLDVKKFNEGNRLDAGRFNIGNDMSRQGFNINNTLGEIRGQRADQLAGWNTAMGTRSADIVGQGMAERGGGKK
jgi:hypothetical protein